MPTPDVGDSIPLCNVAADNGVSSANIQLVNASPNGAFVIVTLNFVGPALRDAVGNTVASPQTWTTFASGPERTRPTLVSATGSVGTTTLTLDFSEPVWCTGLSFDPTDFTMTDNNSSTADPIIVGAGPNSCGFSPLAADTSFSVNLNAALPASTTFTLTITPEANEIQDVVGNDLLNPTNLTFSTGAPDLTAPTIVDTRLLNNVATTDLGDAGDAYQFTFSEPMVQLNTSIATIQLQDLDGTTFVQSCGFNTVCTWNVPGTTLTVTTLIATPSTGGTTPGLQIPATITTLTAFSDLFGNVPDLAGSPDRVIDIE